MHTYSIQKSLWLPLYDFSAHPLRQLRPLWSGLLFSAAALTACAALVLLFFRDIVAPMPITPQAGVAENAHNALLHLSGTAWTLLIGSFVLFLLAESWLTARLCLCQKRRQDAAPAPEAALEKPEKPRPGRGESPQSDKGESPQSDTESAESTGPAPRSGLLGRVGKAFRATAPYLRRSLVANAICAVLFCGLTALVAWGAHFYAWIAFAEIPVWMCCGQLHTQLRINWIYRPEVGWRALLHGLGALVTVNVVSTAVLLFVAALVLMAPLTMLCAVTADAMTVSLGEPSGLPPITLALYLCLSFCGAVLFNVVRSITTRAALFLAE